MAFSLEWFETQSKFTCAVEEQSKTELNNCLQMFYVSIRQKDGSRFKVSSLKLNETLNAVSKDMVKRSQVSPVVHKTPITSEQLQKLYESQQLGEATTTNPTQLLRTVWFYVTLYFGKRGRESQRKLERQMFCLRQTPEGRR